MSELTGTIPETASPVPFRTALPAPASPRTWLRHIVGGGQIVESCPEFCTRSHQYDGHSNLDDLHHSADEVGAEVPVFDRWVDGEPVALSVPALVAQIRLDPYSENPRRNVPFATFELADGQMVDELSPDGLAAYIAQIREHCDRLDKVHAQLVQARVKHGG